MDTVQTAFLDAVGAHLLAEAGGVGGQGQGELVGREDLVNETADHGVFGGADQVQVFPFDLIHHSVHFREGHDALHHVAVDHEGGDDVSKTTVDHEVSGIGQDSLVQARNIAQQVVEAAAGDTTGGLEICTVELVNDVGVIGHLEIRHHRFAEPLDFYVIGVVRADGHGGVDDVGDGEQDSAHLLGQLSGFGG